VPESVVESGLGMASITVDSDVHSCSKSYAYISDWNESQMYVYGLYENRMWKFKHNYMQNEPRNGDLFVAGVKFKWEDGIFSVALGKPDYYTGNRRVFFHSLASTSKYWTTTSILTNESLANSEDYDDKFYVGITKYDDNF
jgi:hypothetical protein